MNRSPKTVGEVSEAQVLAAFLINAETVLMPFGDNQRYDLVLERGGEFIRVQVKTGRLKDGVVRFQTCSSGSTTGHKKKRPYVGEVDCFAVYCPENHQVYLVPIAGSPGTEMSLRLKPVVNGQKQGVRLAVDYEYPHGPVAQSVRARS